MLKRIKKALRVRTNKDLAKKLDVAESSVSRWGSKGFHKSTERLLDLLLRRYEE